ncbi:MAG: thiamine-phosphate kinase [Candidatus Acidiferrales bacterium]
MVERIIRAIGHSLAAPTLLPEPGDDAAIFAVDSQNQWIISTDWFLEGIHFLPSIHPPDSIGFKALARAASDLAAMGAAPRFFLMALALPPSRSRTWLDQMLAGMRRASCRFRLQLAGGDTTRYSSLALNITVIGTVNPGRAISRANARPGHLLYVSGALGGAQLGLQLLRAGASRASPGAKSLLRPHLYPEPRLALGQWLASKQLASAMIDVSDGLSTDLHNLCRASGVGAQVRRAAIPCVNLSPGLRKQDLDPLRLALHGGDDYELLFTIPRRFAHHIPAKFHGLPLTAIGEITKSKRILLLHQDGHTTPLAPSGWDSFMKTKWARR